MALILSLGGTAPVGAAEASLQQLERQHSESSQQLEALQEKLAEARNRPSPERNALREARAHVARAQAAHDAEDSEASAARLQNAEFRLALSERRFDKAHREIEVLTQQIAALEQQLADHRRQREQLQQRQALLQEQRQREAAEEAQREIHRLRALLAAQEARAVEETEQVEKVEESAAPKPALEEASPPPRTAAALPATTESNRSSSAPLLLTDPRQVLALLARVEPLLSSDPRHRLVNQILHLQHGNTRRAHTLRALGEQAYRIELDLAAGTFELVVGLGRWQLTLSEPGRYALLYLTDGESPSLQLYPVELELDTPSSG